MKSRGLMLIVGVAWVACPVASLGSEQLAFRAYQPFNLPNGIFLSPVTYTGYFGAPQQVEMTCWPNRVWHQEPDSGGRRDESVQENLAFASGLKVSVNWGRSWPNHGDTVRATLDVTNLAKLAPAAWRDTALVAATVECIKANAGQSAPHVQFLALTITGQPRYQRYGGVFSVSDYSCGPKRWQFW